MTTEEKARAYDEALKRAEAAIDIAADKDLVKGVATTIFPELRESEDERIRKAIIHYILYETKGNISEATEHVWVTWLEKQKEHQNKTDAPKEKSVDGNFLSSHKDKSLDEIAQDYVDGVKQYNQEPTWDLMQTAVCYGYHLAEQKPAEWSEEEKQKLNRIYEILGYAADDKGFLTSKRIIGDKEAIELQDFLKSLRPSWKPSKEQMTNLLRAEGRLRIEGESVLASKLAELYEQLKKLIDK